MAASSFVLCLSLVLLVTTLGCSAQLGDEEPALISTLQEISNSTSESLRLDKQNTAALSDLQALPDMLQLVKEKITLDIERNMGSLQKELAGLNKVTTLTQEIQDLRAKFEARSLTEAKNTQEIQYLKSKLEINDEKVQNLEERLSVSVQQVDILTEHEKNHNSTVQDLNNRLHESELHVQQLNNTLQEINEIMEILKRDRECRLPKLHEIQDVVQKFNSSKNLKQLREDVDSALDTSSVESQQLWGLVRDDMFTFRLGESGHIQLMKLLLCAGLPVETTDSSGSTMLHGAAQGGHVKMVKLLLQHGAQLDARDEGQDTPLTWAAYEGHLEVVKVLVEAGASTSARAKDGSTALVNARANGHTAVVQYLLPLPH